MIAPLQRQHIRRRQRIALRMRARPRHARPRSSRQHLRTKIVRRPQPRLPVSHRRRPGKLRRLFAAVARPVVHALRPRRAAVLPAAH
ncbi:MAG TPA: hypothetical protein VLH81_03480, partial [Desulfobacterales bacterium]|nr:hypothetical protein [Desulfobacterales bacterium]